MSRNNRRRVPLRKRIKSIGRATRAGAAYLAPLVGLAAIAVAVPMGVYFGYQHVVSTPYFSLEEIHVQGNTFLSPETMLSIAAVRQGMNIFDVDPDVVRQRLQAEPWIRNVTVEKRLPRTLEIRVEERIATAVLVDGDSYTLLDAFAEPFKQMDGADPVDDLLELPLITGMTRAQAATPDGQKLIVEAVDLVALAAEHDIPKLSEVHIDTVMGLSIVPQESGIEIRLGRGNYAERLTRLRAVLAAIEEEAREVDYILVDQENSLNRVTVGSRAVDRASERSRN